MLIEPTATDLLVFENYLVRAQTGKRFLNLIIDTIAFYAILFSVAFALAFLSPGFSDSLAESEGSTGSAIVDNIIYLVIYAVFMGILEAIFKGKSLGKMITRTRAVNLDGSPISAYTAFARGFSRAVPFAAFSALGSPCNPWQDKWTNTMVIDEKKSELQ